MEASPDNVEVLLVSSRSGKGLVFPKVSRARRRRDDPPSFSHALCSLARPAGALCHALSRTRTHTPAPSLSLHATHSQQGGWETDETQAAAAARETLEEAGVRGDLEDSPLGPFACGPSHKAQPGAAADGAASTSTSTSTSSTTAHMFAMHVVEELAVWPEGGQRARVWLPLRVALAAVRHEWMRAALAAWVGRRGWGGLVPDEDGAAAAVAAALAAVPGGRVGKDKDTAAVR